MDATGIELNSPRAVYMGLRQRILRNEILPSSRLNVDKLARELGVSSTPVREALRQLQGDRLVVQHPGKGYSTTPLLNASELREMFEFRLLIEPWAARTAAQDRLSNPGLALEQQVAAFDELALRHPDVRFELVEHDAHFHDSILASVGNSVVHSAYQQAHCHLHAYRLFPNDYNGQITILEHRAVASAIRDRDPAGAEAAMRSHIESAYQRFAAGHAFTGPALPPLPQDLLERDTRLAL